MNPKILLAFAGGLIVASGITYVAMKQSSPVRVEPAQANAHVAVPPAPVTPAPAAVEPAPAEASPVVDESTRTEPVRPSPAPKRTQRVSKPILVASAKAAARDTTPAPANPPAGQTSPPEQIPAAQPPPVQALPPPQEQAPAEVPAPHYEAPAPHQPHTVTIPSGTLLTVRLGETLTTERNQAGDQFNAALDQPLIVDGFVIAERGARTQGRIVLLERSGKVRGLAKLAIELKQIHTADGQTIPVSTAAFSREAESTRNKDAAKVGIGAALGAAIGAMAGGGKGAAIGAGAGSAAGAGDVLVTRGQAAELRVETRVTFRLSEAITITEKLN